MLNISNKYPFYLNMITKIMSLQKFIAVLKWCSVYLLLGTLYSEIVAIKVNDIWPRVM